MYNNNMSNGVVMGSALGIIFISAILFGVSRELSGKQRFLSTKMVIDMIIGALWLVCYLLYVYDGYQTSSSSKLDIWLTGFVVAIPIAILRIYLTPGAL